jgi:hypothetical protein
VETGDGGHGDDTFFGAWGREDYYGGEHNDVVEGGEAVDTVHGDGGDDLVSGGPHPDFIFGEEGNDTLFGEGGDDTLDGGTEHDELFAGLGNDTLIGDEGDDSLFGEAGTDEYFGDGGNDTLVSIGGSQSDVLHGGSALDSFWCDSAITETLLDVVVEETNAGNVHRVGAFMDYEFKDGTVEAVSKELRGQSLGDPEVCNSHQGLEDFVDFSNDPDSPQFPVFTGPVKEDIQQRQLGDCYFLASLASLAQRDQNIIRQSVVDLGDGTYAVRFFENGAEVYVRVDGDLPTEAALASDGDITTDDDDNLFYAARGTEKAMWGPIMEKAWAFFRKHDASYNSIDLGEPTEVATALNLASSFLIHPFHTNAGFNNFLAYVSNEITAGNAVTIVTGLFPSTLLPTHVYVVSSVDVDINGVATVILYNPHGFDEVEMDLRDVFNDTCLTVSIDA